MVMGGDVMMLAEPSARHPPLYPWSLAIVRLFGGPLALQAVVIAQGVLFVATIWIAGHIAARMTKLPRAMPLTMAFSLPSLSALTFSAAALPETLFAFLCGLNLLAILDYAKHGTGGRSVWVGITFALTLLLCPIVVLLWLPHVFFLLYVHVRRRRRLGKRSPGRTRLHHRVLHLGIATITVGILIAPWIMRNQYLFDSPVLTETIGRRVWGVTFGDSWGSELDLPPSLSTDELRRRLDRGSDTVENWREPQRVSRALIRSGLDDVEADRLMRQIAMDAIASNPGAFARQASRRTIAFWNCASTDLPSQGPSAGEFHRQQTWSKNVPPVDWMIEHRWSKSVLLNGLLAAVAGAALLFLMINYPTRPYAVWLALIFAYFAIAIGVLEFPSYRHRIVVESMLAMVGASALAVVLSRRRKPVKLVPPS